ncbi:unnamed protein product [Phytophthora fragariaefolia]|uniref:Unnamed protein product n=1 Tax=Phytophthora fragariaefolia TaxID=1490495 RepID=A0A9W6XKM4_9STRA|nr:unnamed protein product [Phytophthora fragariaefolia]
MGDITRQDLVESDNESKPSDTSDSIDVSLRASPEPPAPARTAASRRPVSEKKREKERWKSVIDNWRTIEGSGLINLANDDKTLKQMRINGWETGLSNYDEGYQV